MRLTTIKMNLHPFRWIPPSARVGVFFASTSLAVVLFMVLQLLDRPLQTTAAPNGIVSFELAGDMAAASAILASWGDEGRVYAALSLGLDYLFLFAYATAIGLACILIGRALEHRRAVRLLAVLFAWAILGAAALDAVENFALIELLLGAQEGHWAPLASTAALLKFAIVACALVFVLAGAGILLLRWLRR
jgi:hypothetical protein